MADARGPAAMSDMAKLKDPPLEMRGVIITTTIEGTINGVPFYFRARHGEWSLQVKEDGISLYESRCIADGEDERLGMWQELLGWWAAEDALAFCRTQIGKYLNSKAERCNHDLMMSQHCEACGRE